jgi:hypothetical protein
MSEVSVRGWLLVVLMLIGLQMVAPGQNPPPPKSPPEQQNPPEQKTGDEPEESRPVPAGALTGIGGVDTEPGEESSEDLPRIPAMLGGQGGSLALGSEERSNYLRGGVNLTAGYDDNAFLRPNGEVGNTTFSIFPNIAIEQATSRTEWSLGYGGGFTVNQRLTDRNQGAHVVHFDSGFRLSPHVNLRVSEDFSLTAGIFGGSTPAAFQPGIGGANTNFITPLAKQRSSATVAGMDYHFALKDMVGASGSFYDLHYSDSPSGSLTTLVNTRTETGSAFWLHQIFRRDWAGLSYRYERVTFGPIGETQVHGFRVTNTLTVSKTVSVTAYLGPEHSHNQGIAASSPDAGVSSFGNWSINGGVEANWQASRTSLAGGYSQETTDGGGLLGAVRLQSVHAVVRREVIPGWATSLGVTHGRNRSLTLASSNSAALINTTSVAVALDRNLGRSLGLQLGYYHDLQDQSGSHDPLQNFDANRNRFFVTLSYQWAKAIGR